MVPFQNREITTSLMNHYKCSTAIQVCLFYYPSQLVLKPKENKDSCQSALHKLINNINYLSEHKRALLILKDFIFSVQHRIKKKQIQILKCCVF